jgi:phage terminase large subunit-like protein
MRTLKEIVPEEYWKEPNDYRLENISPEFYERCLDVRFFCNHVLGQNIAPYHDNILLHVDNNQFPIVVSFRGSGKTYTALILFSIYAAFTQPNRKDDNYEILLCSKTLPQARRQLMEPIKNLIYNNEFLKTSLPSAKSQKRSIGEKMNADIITFKNGSSIAIAPANDSARGFHPDIAGVDEASTTGDAAFFNEVLRPMIDYKHGKIILTSTPKGAMGYFYEQIRQKDAAIQTVPAEDDQGNLTGHPSYTREVLDRAKESMGLEAYAQEYLCKFIASNSAVFPPDVIEQIMLRKEPMRLNGLYDLPNKDMTIYMGVDFARTQDYNVFTVVGKYVNGPYRVIAMFRDSGVDHTKVIMPQLRTWMQYYKPVRVCMDATILGSTIFDQIKGEGYPVENVNFTKDKVNMVNNLKMITDNGAIEIPYNPQIFEELSYYFKTTTKSGAQKFEATRGHDDIPSSLMLAAWAARDANSLDNYKYASSDGDIRAPQEVQEVLEKNGDNFAEIEKHFFSGL